MVDLNAAKQNWGKLHEIVEQGVETLPQLLLYQAKRFGEAIFHRKKDFGIWQSYSWNTVVLQVQNMAMGLSSLGVKRGQTVAIVGENEPELFWSEYAAHCLGAKVICLYPDLTPPQMEFLLLHSESVVVICQDQEQVDKLLELDPRLTDLLAIVYWDNKGMWNYRHPKLMAFQEVQEKGLALMANDPDRFQKEVAAGGGNDMAVLSYTSGTTGVPKGCILTHHFLFDSAFRLAGANPLKLQTQYLSYISPAWGTEQILGLTMGALIPFVVNFPEEPETVQENIREIGTEAIVLSPRQWESLASLVESKMLDAGPIRRALYKSGLSIGRKRNMALLEDEKVSLGGRMLYLLADRLVLFPLRDKLGLQAATLTLSGGSGMASDVFRFFHAMGVPLRNIYGSTEMGLFSQHQGQAFNLETVGRLLPVHPYFGPPLEFKVTEESELLVQGGSGFSGYFKNPGATAKKMDEGWYRTEDAVSVTDKGEIIYLERVDDMRQLSAGHKYPPQFIENRLRFSAFIKDAMTLGDQDKSFVAAFINIDFSTVGAWAEQNRIGYTTFTDLSQNEKVRQLMAKEIEKVNVLLPEGSRIKRFINLPKELDPDEDELTRTRKLRRNFLEQKYKSFIRAIYSGDNKFEANVPVRYLNGRTGVLNAMVYINDLILQEQP